ncbi:hypothetical protein [Salipiger abyssi]|uniref:hypothetical protein n=1 Tax=Salipiger abyssi TaxID=1250539 RepID=UPI001A907B8C|nr:hypothetical protein [Salipiger abyssi]MBN9886489.1 hypothetical protein [Salipiger abyssi]
MTTTVSAKLCGALCLGLATALLAPVAASADSGSRPNTRDLPLTYGRSIPLTYAEQQQLIFLVPGLDPAMIPAGQSARLRDVIYSDRTDSEKRRRIKWLLDL